MTPWRSRPQRAARAVLVAVVLAHLVMLVRCVGGGGSLLPRYAMAADRATLERQLLAVQELHTRQMEASFRVYAKEAWKILEPQNPIIWNWHIDAKCDVLQGVTEGHLQHVIINEPPRNSKSSTLTLWHTWEWGPANRPDTRWLCGSHAASLATRDTRLARAVMQSPWYRKRWGQRFEFTGDQNLKMNFENSKRGRRIAFGFDAGVTGEGGSRLQIDDAIDLKDADNPTELARINHIWDTALFSRVDNPARDAMVIAGQRVGKGDLCDHVKDQHDWTWLVLPAEFEPHRRTRLVFRRDQCTYWITDKGQRQKQVVGTVEAVVEDPRTVEKEVLNPARFPASVLASIRTASGTKTFKAQQQQDPVDAEGTIIKRAWFRYYTPGTMPAVVDQVIVSWDTAVKDKKKNDQWAGEVWAKSGSMLWLMRVLCDRMAYHEGRDNVKALYSWAREKFPSAPITNLIENTASGPDLQIDLAKIVPGLIVVSVDGDKGRRLRAVSPLFEAGNVLVPGRANNDGTNYDTAVTPIWAQEFIDEVCGFDESATQDDRVDSCTQALAKFQSAPLVVPPSTAGGTATHATRL